VRRELDDINPPHNPTNDKVAQECKPFHVSRNLASLRNWGTVSDGGLAVFLFSDCVEPAAAGVPELVPFQVENI
jgi:hypothetical protein